MSVEIAIPPTPQAVGDQFWGKKDRDMIATEQKFRAEFERLASENPHGLVRMKFVESEAPYMQGQIAGLYPDEALGMLSHEKAAPCDENGEFIPLKAVVKRSEAPKASNTVEIPDNWSALHHLQKIRLAKEIRGSEEPIKLDDAEAVIQAEVERRNQ